MGLINPFDPWKSKLCTCPPKYSFSPYTGCSHGCIYCYASSYIPRFFECRPKQRLIERLSKELVRIDKKLPISISNSSDPYPPMEEKLKLTRSCLRILAQNKCKILLVTKSNLVCRDLDILRRARVCVSLTITTLNEKLARKLEPGAPSPKERIEAAEKLIKNRVPVAVRVDPIIPGVNEEEIEAIVEKVAEIGIEHVTSSTYKVKFDNWRRFELVFPEKARFLRPLYFENGKKISGSYYLPRRMRMEIMKRVRKACDQNGISFACCREGLKLNTAKSCDASHLIP